MKSPHEYWINKNTTDFFTCPNVSLFRLIGGIYKSLENKNILEVGFGHGADLIECDRRGACVKGLDLNPNYVHAISQKTDIAVRTFCAGKNEIPFPDKFDLIYSRDTIYYLSDIELKHFLIECSKSLDATGFLILQFIEADLERKNLSSNKKGFELNFLENYLAQNQVSTDNPIRYINLENLITIASEVGLSLTASKIMMQSYDLDEDYLRVDRYAVFSRRA